jgi:hypothetical protein
MNYTVLFFVCTTPFLIATRPTNLHVDTTRNDALIPLDPLYENRVLHACLQGDSSKATELLQDKDSRILSEHFFKDIERALDASHSCRPTDMCVISSAASGILAALFAQAVAPAGCPYAPVLIPFGGCVIGTLPTGAARVLSYSSQHEELKTDLRTYVCALRKKAVLRQPPAQLSMQFQRR